MTRPRALGGLVAVAAATLVIYPATGQAVRGQTSRPALLDQTPRPALLVLIVVDQFRADYVEMYGHQWTDGLRDIFQQGAVFTRASVPYGMTRTCTGHSSIATGTRPATHGIVDNEWFDRAAGRFVGCTEDASVGALALGPGRAIEPHSARALRAPTFADELRRQSPTPPRVVSIALKARSAISLVGQGGPGTVVMWEEDSGTWATSTAYATVPMPEVAGFLAAHPAHAARGSTWNRRLPIEAYLFDDRARGEPSNAVFPHTMRPPFGGSFTPIWDASPFSDAYIGDLAISLSESPGRGLGLGRTPATDLLLLSFAALDYVGHAYGPRSHEVQDVLARLDVVLGQLMEVLDQSVGRDRYVLALTSDHGVAPLPVETGGRVSVSAVGRAVDAALAGAFAGRPSVRAVSGSSIYLTPGAIVALRSNASLKDAVERTLMNVPGIARVYWPEQLGATGATQDTLLAAMRASYAPDRSGDLMFVPSRHWVISDAGTNHGTPYDYDAQVPIALIGSQVARGRYGRPASILDVAPTFAALAGITMPRAQGRVLSEALGPAK